MDLSTSCFIRPRAAPPVNSLYRRIIGLSSLSVGRCTMKKRLAGRVVVVTGASRGAGRGIACVLGEEGATVYATGRSVRGSPTTDNMPGTVEDTADEVTRRGGAGIPVLCDHTVDEQVEALF